MKFRSLGGLCVLALCAGATIGSALADPKGLWLAKDGAHMLVNSCGKALCGTLATTNLPLDPDTGQPWTDKFNPDPNKRNRPLIGVQILISMIRSGPAKWSGQLYNTDDGRTYEGNLIEVDAKTITVEGCAAPGFCGGQNMDRIK